MLLQDPRIHRGDQVVAAEEIHLQGQDAEQQVAVGTPWAITASRAVGRSSGPAEVREGGLDQFGTVGEPLPIFALRWPLAMLAAVGQLDGEQRL